ncbi:hypothetical protein Tco_0575043 [Tanacetum coccineum]
MGKLVCAQLVPCILAMSMLPTSLLGHCIFLIDYTAMLYDHSRFNIYPSINSDLLLIVEKQLMLEMLVDESLKMIVDESLEMIVDESLMVEDKSLEKLVDETLKLDEEHFESVIADYKSSHFILNFLKYIDA